jgi:hypothetical protein
VRTEKFLQQVAADGRVLLDEETDPFASVAASQPVFAAWRTERLERTVTAPDKSKHQAYACAFAEARAPTEKGNVKATPMVIELAEAMARGGLEAMRDPKRAVATWLASQHGADFSQRRWRSCTRRHVART